MLKRIRSQKTKLLVLAMPVAFTSIFAVGVVTGLVFYPRLFITDVNQRDDHHDRMVDKHLPDEADHEEEHVALTRNAFENLGLRLGRLTRGDYWKSVLMPGEVVEIPGRSDLSVSAPVTGVVEEVRILPGESIAAQQPLFVIRITDEELTDAQAKLLAALVRQDVVRQEIQRLDPIIQSGAVSGKATARSRIRTAAIGGGERDAGSAIAWPRPTTVSRQFGAERSRARNNT